MSAEIINADVIDGLRRLPDRSIQCCITSPPYWGLRDYRVEGQIGLERTPEEYVARLVEVFREVRRVLRDDGTLWLNLGDSFASGKGTCYNPGGGKRSIHQGSKDAGAHPLDRGNISDLRRSGLKPKDLVGIPWRVAFALQEDGWYLRSDIIWHKPNPMPESVRDRPTKAHEYMFLLAKSARYFYDADAVREESVTNDARRPFAPGQVDARGNGHDRGGGEIRKHPFIGRNRRDVWTIPTRPYKGAHFATFPLALVEPCLLAGTSEAGCCPICGAPWARVIDRVKARRTERSDNPNARGLKRYPSEIDSVRTAGWRPSCDHDAAPVPCTVLDPFGGSGTVGAVAAAHGRDAVLIELNPEYVALARERVAETETCLAPTREAQKEQATLGAGS